MKKEELSLGQRIILDLKKRLYIYVFVVFVIALVLGYYVDFTKINIKAISLLAVFIMLYPMLTGMVIEKVKSASKDYKLIISTLVFAYFIASGTAYLISRTILVGYPNLALAIVLVGAIPCSNMLIGWSGIADAQVESALVIAVIGLLLISVLSPLLITINGMAFVSINIYELVFVLLSYIIIPLILGYFTRYEIIKRKGKKYFMHVKMFFPGISAIGILLIIFFSVAKVARFVIATPEVFLLVIVGLFSYYLIQTTLSVVTAKILGFEYERGFILVLGATASSQAISLALAATLFSSLTVFALSFKPLLQVLYILFLIYAVGPSLKKFLGTKSGIDVSKEAISEKQSM